MTTRSIRALISGRVQGVFFRESTRQEALRLGLTGSAVNLPDGRVEVIACGDDIAVDDLIKWLHLGPPMASVKSVEVSNIAPFAATGFTTG